ncbi:Fic family protein [Lysinibacillus sp. MHQ-1]|nr:Fic family protein [Lysinibacillus sp. MHQ-1]
MAEINVLHPFREGNGRTQTEFIRLLAMKKWF